MGERNRIEKGGGAEKRKERSEAARVFTIQANEPKSTNQRQALAKPPTKLFFPFFNLFPFLPAESKRIPNKPVILPIHSFTQCAVIQRTPSTVYAPSPPITAALISHHQGQ